MRLDLVTIDFTAARDLFVELAPWIPSPEEQIEAEVPQIKDKLAEDPVDADQFDGPARNEVVRGMKDERPGGRAAAVGDDAKADYSEQTIYDDWNRIHYGGLLGERFVEIGDNIDQD